MLARQQILAVIPLFALCATTALGQPQQPLDSAGQESQAARLLASIKEPGLRDLVAEVLERNPSVHAAVAQARAAALRAPQVRALPDPVAGVTAFLATPETRTGPQRFSMGLSQGLPWFGKLDLKEKAALFEASALQSEIEAQRLKLVTETRRLYLELAFLQRQREITDSLRSHLLNHEEIARARYSSGAGFGQGVIKLQAEITRSDNELLGIDSRRTMLIAQVNALRDRPASTALPPQRLPEAEEVALDLDSLLETALQSRPELKGADARIARAETLVSLAEKGYRPDFMVGLTYTMVDPRDDPAGRAQPPAGNGDDILGIQGGITVPLWRGKLAAGVEEAVALTTTAEERKRALAADIEAAVGDLAQRLPLTWQQFRLLDDLLIVQAQEALDSAQAGYVVSTLNALDLLDAEHVLFLAHTATARAQADYLIGVANLEGAVAVPLEESTKERSDS
jgi:outer membrane protein, heavy metal efflux system